MSLDDILTKQTAGTEQSRPTLQASGKSFPVWLIPFGIILGFAFLFLVVLWPQFKPSLSVNAERALPLLNQASSQSIQAESSAEVEMTSQPSVLLFQAAGWLEPNPLPERVSSLVSGTVDKTYVTDGDKVEKGQLLAELIDTDFQFALQEAKANLNETESDIALRQTEVETARAMIRMEEANLTAAEALMQNFKDTHERYSKLASGVVSDQAVIQARQELRQQEALVIVAEARIETSKTGLNEAEARLASAEAAREKAEVNYRHAKLNLERCRIYSPITGRVLKMMATPGSRLNVDADQTDGATLAQLYDPNELSLRMDVPIEQAAHVFIGQPSEIRCAIFPDKIFKGEVIRIAGEADIQRNALQVRIRLSDPDDQLRPAMPCRAEVFSNPVQMTSTKNSGSFRPSQGGTTQGALIPAAALTGEKDNPHVWVIDLDNRASLRSVTLLPSENREGYLAVAEGVFPGEPVILNPSSDLKQNDSVRTQNL